MYTRSTALNLCFKRFYNGTQRNKTLPLIKVASTRVGRALKSRRHAEAQVESYDPSKRFQPFPFAITNENKVEVLRTKVTPLHNIPYEEQLASKESFCRNTLRVLAQDLYKRGTPVRLDARRLPCPVGTIIRSPQTTKYRNRDEFSMWRGIDGRQCVGHTPFPVRLHGDTICIEPDGCLVTGDVSIKAAKIATDFLRNQANLPICYKLGYEGGWRRIATRVNVNGDLMLIGFMSPTTLKVQQVVDERENFRDFMVAKCKEAGLKLESLYFQPCPHNKCSHAIVPYELLYGSRCLVESIDDYKFLVSPESFFPNNTLGAGTLYKSIVDVINGAYTPSNEPKMKPLIIDSSCGAGMLATYLSKIASKVIGIDGSNEAIKDAQENAKLNNITNMEFLGVSPEIALDRIIQRYSGRRSDSIVVSQAPRVGIGRDLARALRESDHIKRMIYVTSKPDSIGTTSDLIELCSKGSERISRPFVPVAAQPVDTTPQVDACDFIIALEKISS